MTFQKFLSTITSKKFLQNYYGNHGCNIWLYKNKRWVIKKQKLYPDPDSSVCAIMRCKGLTTKQIKQILKDEELEPIPHFELINFIRNAVYNYDKYNIYFVEL